jgi:hypothetical protein
MPPSPSERFKSVSSRAWGECNSHWTQSSANARCAQIHRLKDELALLHNRSATFQLASGRHEAALSSLSSLGSLGAGVGSMASAAELDEMRQTLQRVLAQLQQLQVKSRSPIAFTPTLIASSRPLPPRFSGCRHAGPSAVGVKRASRQHARCKGACELAVLVGASSRAAGWWRRCRRMVAWLDDRAHA